jgi:hypothetical protein
MNSSSATSASARVRAIASFLLRPSVGQPSRGTFPVRLAVGGVFLTWGLVKFLLDNQGPRRCAPIAPAHPSQTATTAPANSGAEESCVP